jgi:hypothetical protein
MQKKHSASLAKERVRSGQQSQLPGRGYVHQYTVYRFTNLPWLHSPLVAFSLLIVFSSVSVAINVWYVFS